MARKIGLVVALALLLTCGPTAVTTAPSASPTASLTPIASTDLVTLREGGQQPVLSVRKVANADLVTSLPDGLLLPDGTSLLVVERGATQTTVKKLARLTGATLSSTQIPGGWDLMRGWPSFSGLSPDGSHLVLYGNSYNFTDQTGTWTAKTTFGVLDLATWRVDPIELAGRFDFEAVSNDGRLVYLADQSSNASRTRIFDTRTRQLRDMPGDTMFSTVTYASGFAFGMVNAGEEIRPRPDVIQVTTVNKLARLDLETSAVSLLPLPIGATPSGEDALAWSLLPTRDGRTLYAVNPLVAVVSEIDLATLQVRRTVPLSDAHSAHGLLDLVAAALHPVAAAKMEFLQGATFSPDQKKIYALALDGIWSIDVASLKGSLLTRSGAYQSLKISPDGARLYVIGRENATVTAIDTTSGAILGSMKRVAAPSDIVAVDAG